MATILIIEDERSILMLLTMLLSQQYTVLEATNGKEGLELFQQYRPDIIITDLSMRGGHGLDLIREVRAIDPKVKIIVSSGDGNMKQRSLYVDVDRWLEKPLSLTTLELAVAELLNSQ